MVIELTPDHYYENFDEAGALLGQKAVFKNLLLWDTWKLLQLMSQGLLRMCVANAVCVNCKNFID